MFSKVDIKSSEENEERDISVVRIKHENEDDDFGDRVFESAKMNYLFRSKYTILQLPFNSVA